MINEIVKHIKDSEMILVGIGEAFEERFKIEDMKEKEQHYFKMLMEKEERDNVSHISDPKIKALMNPENVLLEDYIKADYLRNNENLQLKETYATLSKLLEGKNYYIISLCKDNYIDKVGLKKERIVKPCGSYSFMQCSNKCSDEIYDADEYINHVIKQIDEKNIEQIDFPKCKKCGSNLVFNTTNAQNYNENGYIEQWKIYMKWLQGTVNRKLCVLELGVGLQYPTVIRWPFEKIAFINQKSTFYRIHENLAKFPEELQDRGISIKENPVEFLKKMEV